ncbi:MAG: protein kinase [Phormidesmis sp.]
MLINHRYQVIRPLGEGGFGHAYLAEDTQMPSRRKCVVKQLKPITTSAEVYQVVQDRFQREAAILEQLGENHPQIPRLHAYFSEDQKFYLVQEWIEGETLENIAVPMSEAAVVDLMVSLLPVLDFIHRQGIIHRDLKPDNIILRSGTRQPVLIDFGAVRETMGTVMNSRNHPTSSIVIGTPGFMASEQAAGRPIPSSDLYSLGLTAIFLLTGQMPQAFSSDVETGELIWQQAASQVSAGLLAVIDRAIRSHPRDRYPTAPAMLSALNSRAGVTVAASAPPPLTGSTPAPAVLPVAQPASQFKTMAVAPAAQTPSVQTPSTQTPSTQTADTAETAVSAPTSPDASRGSGGALPWFKTLTPLTLGLIVAAVGIASVGGGLLVSRLSTDSTVAPLASPSRSDEPLAAGSADTEDLPQTADDDLAPAGSEDNSSDDSADSADEPANSANIPAVDNQAATNTASPAFGVTAGQQLVVSNSSRDRISIHQSPSFDAPAPSYGINGDIVTATGDVQQAADDLFWYRVRFESGVEGWIPQFSLTQGNPQPLASSDPELDLMARLPKYAELAGASGDRVNIRSAPSSSASSPHYGLGGDAIQILDAARGADGYDWYQVAFESGADGWVRSDLVRLP